MRFLAFIFIIVLISPASAYVAHERDYFKEYRDFVKRPTVLKPRNLVHYAASEKLIIDKFKLELSEKERSIILALYWLIGFADKDDNFDELSTDFILLLHEMSHSKGRKHQREVAQAILKTSLARAEKRLSEIFSKDARINFIGLLHILLEHPEFEDSYHRFYEEQFALKDPSAESEEEQTDFSKALRTLAYEDIMHQLIDASFLHYYLVKAKKPIKGLPVDNFAKFLNELKSLKYNEHYEFYSDKFADLSYLATHVPLVLTNYGEFVIHDGKNMRKAQAYIEHTLDRVYRHGDFELFAEYLQAIKIFNPKDVRIGKLEDIILDLQRADGSWGTEETFSLNPYQAMHPTWTAITALNQ